MNIGVIVSNSEDYVVLMPEIWVAIKVCSSLSSGMLKVCGPRSCALPCLRPSWIKLSMADMKRLPPNENHIGHKRAGSPVYCKLAKWSKKVKLFIISR